MSSPSAARDFSAYLMRAGELPSLASLEAVVAHGVDVGCDGGTDVLCHFHESSGTVLAHCLGFLESGSPQGSGRLP